MATRAFQSFTDGQGDNLSVKMFQAKGDGVTDDTSAIQEALNEVGALANGGSLFFPHSHEKYMIKTIKPPSNCRMYGPGTLDIVDDGTSTGHSIFLDGVSNVTLDGLQIISSNATTRTGVYGNVRSQNCNGLRLLNLNINGGSSMGLYHLNCADVLVQGCRVKNTWADGIGFQRASKHIRVIDNYVELSGDDAISFIGYTLGGGTWAAITDVLAQGNQIYNLTKLVGRGMSMYGVVGGKFINNSIDTTHDAGIIVSATLGSDPVTATHCCRDIVLENNTVKAPGNGVSALRTGIFISHTRTFSVKHNRVDLAPGDGISISFVAKEGRIGDGNELTRITGRGIITFSQHSSDTRVLQELFTDVGETAPGSTGITDIDITGNRTRTTGDFGISCEIAAADSFTPTGIRIVDNVIRDAAASSITPRGISVLNADDVIVSSNEVLDAIGTGITIGTCARPKAHGNIVQNAVSYGIGFISCVDPTASAANIVTGCGGVGIFSDIGTTNPFIFGNRVASNAGGNIVIDNTGGVTFHGGAQFSNFGDDYIAGTQTYLQAAVNHRYGVNIGNITSPFVPITELCGEGGPTSGLGAIGWSYTDVLSGSFWKKLVTVGWTQILIGLIDLTSQVTGILPILNGGTGASTSAGAITNLGAAAAANTYTKGQVDSLIATEQGARIAADSSLSSGLSTANTNIAGLSSSKADHGTYVDSNGDSVTI